MEACNGSHARMEVRNVSGAKRLRPRYARTCVSDVRMLALLRYTYGIYSCVHSLIEPTTIRPMYIHAPSITKSPRRNLIEM